MKSNFTQYYLFIGGLTMLAIGGYIALVPIEYLSSLGVSAEPHSNVVTNQTLNGPINLMSDLRGMGGMLLILGLYIFSGAFRQSMRQAGLLISSLVYSAFFLFRTVSFITEGLPDIELLIAYSIELSLALAGIALIQSSRERSYA